MTNAINKLKLITLLVCYALIFSVGGYAYGYYKGSNLPQVDRTAIEKAVFQAMIMEQ